MYGIKIGDKVDVYWDGYLKTETYVEVMYIPCATGDSWVFRRVDKTLVYVNSFGKMVKRR